MATKTDSMAQYIDRLLVEGVSWEKLAQRASAEAKKRNTATLSTMSALKSHVKYRASQTTKWDVEITDVGCRMNAIAQPKAEKPKAAKAKPAPKNGKAFGRKVAKTTENGRQTVTEPAPEQKPEAA